MSTSSEFDKGILFIGIGIIQSYGVSRTTPCSGKQLKKETGKITPTPLNREPRKIDRDKLKNYVEQNTDKYCKVKPWSPLSPILLVKPVPSLPAQS